MLKISLNQLYLFKQIKQIHFTQSYVLFFLLSLLQSLFLLISWLSSKYQRIAILAINSVNQVDFTFAAKFIIVRFDV